VLANGPLNEYRAANNANISFLFVEGEALTVELSLHGVYVSSGNAYSGLKFVGAPKLGVLTEPTSVGDIGAIIGAMIAAMLSNEFRIRRNISKLDVVKSIVGDVLMAFEVSLAFGCNWGGFLSAITSWSLHGFAFLLGALFGGYMGLRYTLWKS